MDFEKLAQTYAREAGKTQEDLVEDFIGEAPGTFDIYDRIAEAHKKRDEEEKRKKMMNEISTKPYNSLVKSEKKILLRQLLEDLQYIGMIKALNEYTVYRRNKKAKEKAQKELNAAKTLQDLIADQLVAREAQENKSSGWTGKYSS